MRQETVEGADDR